MNKIKPFVDKMNQWTAQAVPYVFLIDFELQKPVIFSLDKAAENDLFYDIKGNTNFHYRRCEIKQEKIIVKPINFSKYRKVFKQVQKHLQNGDTYLLNLTCQTPIDIGNDFEEIFQIAKAPYKLFWRDKFVLFSPETFIRIERDKIFSYPMKGTINANIPNAKKLILSDKKELYEHNTIVDLIRNDLSMIAENVMVSKFRFLDLIQSKIGKLFQVSSEIQGDLEHNWQARFGDKLIKLLPAGSVSGAPKQKTLKIIQQVEGGKRGYYTGIFGIFDGKNIDSAVNIRYVESIEERKFYRSGGGITVMSDLKEEYNELKQKIYVPTN